MRTPAQRQRRGQRGAAMVEFAIVAMVFFTLVFGLLDFGLGIFYYNMLSNAAREGARAGIINSASVTTDTMCNAAVARLVVPGVDHTAPHGCTGYGAKLDVQAQNSAPGGEVSVQLTYVYEPITPLVQALVGQELNLVAFSSMIKEQ